MLNDIRNDVETGTNLPRLPRSTRFTSDALYCNLVEAGSGRYPGFRWTVSPTTREKIPPSRTRSSPHCSHPLVMVVAAIVISVMMLFVMPSFQNVFASFGADRLRQRWRGGLVGLLRRLLVPDVRDRGRHLLLHLYLLAKRSPKMQIFVDRATASAAGHWR